MSEIVISFQLFLAVEDGTGRLLCCMWHNQEREIDLVEATFGDLVTVMGRITTFREERQITISSLCILILRKLSSSVIYNANA